MSVQTAVAQSRGAEMMALPSYIRQM